MLSLGQFSDPEQLPFLKLIACICLLLSLSIIATDNSIQAQTARSYAPPVIRRSHANTETGLFRRLPSNDLGQTGDGNSSDASSYSFAKERMLGSDLSLELNRHLQFVKVAAVDKYLNGLVETLVQHSDSRMPVTVSTILDDEVNAYTLPGGFIYVDSGLILAVDDEASLACMLAHEVAHVAARHGVKYLLNASKLTTRDRLNGFYRTLESEADTLGIEYTYAAGYDPRGCERFFAKLRRRKLSPPMEDHPPLSQRLRRARLEAAAISSERNYAASTNEFALVQALLQQLSSKDSKRRNGSLRAELQRLPDNCVQLAHEFP